MLNVLSWGVGLQSTTILEMAIRGELSIDLAIFADTGFEHDYSYDIYDHYAPRAKKAGIEVVKIGDQDIFGDQRSHVSVPMFIYGGEKRGRMTKRMCTRDYKIRPIQRVIRDKLGVNRKGRLKAGLVNLSLGITVDEIERAKDSRVAFIVHQFPLERNSAVSQNNLLCPFSIFEIREVLPGYPVHVRIDFVKSIGIARLGVGSDRTNP